MDNHKTCQSHDFLYSSPSDDERPAEVVLPDALCLLVAVCGGLADAAQARQRYVVVRRSALPLLAWKMVERKRVQRIVKG